MPTARIMAKGTYDWNKRLEMELNRLQGKFQRKEKKAELEKLPVASQKEQKIILDFVDDCKAEGLSYARICYYLQALRLMKRYVSKDIDTLTKQDMKKFMAQIESSDYGEWSKQGFRIAMKKFYRWLYTEKKGQKLRQGEYPEIVEWINTTMKESKKKLPEATLNEDDVKLLIENTENLRDKALIMLLWDSGCRISELLNLQLKDLNFDEHGATIVVEGKTGARRVRLIPSVPYLANWKENHPLKNEPKAHLFVGLGTKNFHKRLAYSTIECMLRKLKDKSGIKKRINPHAFRHARATFYASRVPESVMKEAFGWTQKSQMVATYVHLSGKEVDRRILEAQGVKGEEKKEESKLTPKKCPRCEMMNPATANFCNRCNSPLDLKTALEQDQKIREMVEKIIEERLKQRAGL